MRQVFVIDGSNVAMVKDGTPSALLEAERALEGAHPGAEVVVVVDRSWIGWHRHNGTYEDKSLLDQLGDRGSGHWQPQPADTAADALILAIASKRGGIVVSRDQFHDYQVQYPFLTENGRRLAPAYLSAWVFTPAHGTVASAATIAKKVAAEDAKRQAAPVLPVPPPEPPPRQAVVAPRRWRSTTPQSPAPPPRQAVVSPPLERKNEVAAPKPQAPDAAHRAAPRLHAINDPSPFYLDQQANETGSEWASRQIVQHAAFMEQEPARAAARARIERNDNIYAAVFGVIAVLAFLVWWLA